MKKKYTSPAVELVEITEPDIIMASAVRLTGVTLGILDIDADEVYR